MKNKKWFGLLGLGLSLGVIGGAVGTTVNQEPLPVSAADAKTEKVTLAGTFNGWNTESHPFAQEGTGPWTLTQVLNAGDLFKVLVTPSGGNVEWIGWGNGLNYPAGAFADANSDGNIKCVVGGQYKFTAVNGIGGYGDKTYGITIEKSSATIRTITKWAVLDGVKQTKSIGTDSVADGDTYTPADYHLKNYHFEGWYVDETCATPWTPKAVNANLDVYAKMTTIVPDNYIYYVGGNAATTDYVYAFGGDEQFGSWPGSKITDVGEEVHGTLRLGGTERYIYKIPMLLTDSDTGLIINNGKEGEEATQTKDLLLTGGSAYDWSLKLNGHDAITGDAIDFLLEAEALRNAVKADEEAGIKAYSICGISESDARSLVQKYDALDPKAKTIVDKSTTYTYGGASQTDVPYLAIVNQLRIQAQMNKPLNFLNPGRGNNVVTYAVVGVVAAAAIALSAFFLIRRKKQH